MEINQLKYFSHDKIPSIIEELDLPEEIKPKLETASTDIKIIHALNDASLFNSTIRFLALGLPKRQAIWWAYLTAQTIDGNSDNLHAQNALRLTEGWVKNPDDAKRYSAKELADILQLYTPSAWAAMAIFWSGNNIAPKGRTPVLPGPFMSGHAVANTVILSAESSEKPLDQVKYFLKQGMHIAMGGNGKI